MQRVKYSNVALLKTLWFFISPYKWKFISASLMRLSADIVWLYPAFALATVVTFFTNYSSGQSLNPFWITIFLWSIASVWRYIGMYYGKYWGYQVGERIELDAQIKSMDHLFHLGIDWHEKENSGNKLKKIDRGSAGLQMIIRQWFGSFIEIGVNIIGVTFIIAKFDTFIAFLVFVFILTYFVISYIYIGKATAATQIVNIQEEEVHGLLFESINNIRSVKVMSMISPLYNMLFEASKNLFEKIKKRIFWFQSGHGVKSVWTQLFRVGILVIIALGIIEGEYEIGFLVLFYTYFSNISQSVSELAEVSQEFAVAKFGVGRMTDMLNVPLPESDRTAKTHFPKDWKKITVSNLSFSYGNKKVLDDISFEINRGEKIGIIGLSGAGKSTLFKMLLNEHEHYSGSILIDDVSVKKILRKEYFSRVAVVLQDTEVFNFSLRDNITISNHDHAKDEDLLKKSLSIAHVADFAATLPQKLDTTIGEKGIRLSGGEKQRVGIARAVFKNPEILLLDEATSHLDVESEEKIQDSLHQFFQTVTALVIAHRLTTIKEMDRILVLEGGKIIEEGDFDTLYKKEGRFFELWEKQKI